MATLSSNGLRLLLQKAVVELIFVRRHPKNKWPDSRRMLATNCPQLLNSLAGRVAFKFNPPTGRLAYDPKKYNLVGAYDLFWLEFRMIPAESVNIISAYEVNTKPKQDIFWKWFSDKNGIAYWTSKEKENFMKS